MHIVGFTLAHCVLVIIGLGVVAPRWFNVFISPRRRNDGKVETTPNVTMSAIDAEKDERIEAGLSNTAESERKMEK